MDFENKPALYEQVKKALIKSKDCFSISSTSNCEENSLSQFKRENSRIRQRKDNQMPIKANGVIRKKINPSGADGKILKCIYEMTAQTVGKIRIKRKIWELNIEKCCVILTELY